MGHRAKTRRTSARHRFRQRWRGATSRPRLPPPSQDPQDRAGPAPTVKVPEQAGPPAEGAAGKSPGRSRDGRGTERPGGAAGGVVEGGEATPSVSVPPLLQIQHVLKTRDPSPWLPDGGHAPGSHGLSGTQSDSAICRQELVGSLKLFYGARMGSETRNVEFKRGEGGYLRCTFRAHLRRYACAFLNSGCGGGTLLVGVDDDGVVRGLRIGHRQEDRLRVLADSVLRGFQPLLLPHRYSLRFLPVVRPGWQGRSLKVLAFHVEEVVVVAAPPDPSPTPPPPPRPADVLYQTDQGEVYLRRDGSVEGPLSPRAIQEWARQRWGGEVGRLQGNVDLLLCEQRLQSREVQRLNRTVAVLRRELQRRPPAAKGPTVRGPTAKGPATRGPSSRGPAVLSLRLTAGREGGGRGAAGGVVVEDPEDPGDPGEGPCCLCGWRAPGSTRRTSTCQLM